MLYEEIIALCSQIHTNHINCVSRTYSIWMLYPMKYSRHRALEGLIFFQLRYSATDFKDKQFSCYTLKKFVINKVKWA
jgi:hypothetical protein